METVVKILRALNDMISVTIKALAIIIVVWMTAAVLLLVCQAFLK